MGCYEKSKKGMLMKNNGDGTEKNCGGCTYCTDLKDEATGIIDTKKGICRRFPPQIIVATIKSLAVLPNGQRPPSMQMAQGLHPHVALATPACGEWKDKK
jgi:hypothetical protein